MGLGKSTVTDRCLMSGNLLPKLGVDATAIVHTKLIQLALRALVATLFIEEAEPIYPHIVAALKMVSRAKTTKETGTPHQVGRRDILTLFLYQAHPKVVVCVHVSIYMQSDFTYRWEPQHARTGVPAA